MTSPANPQDPAGLLERITELRPLCTDGGVSRAVASGNPFKVYRALVWARLTGRLSGHRRTVDQLLKNRRAFARPLRGKLWLGTVNGFGAALLGSAEAEPDGTRIATHSLVFLFRLPVFPLGAYVVSREGGSALSTSWRIYARVPLGGLAWAWSRLVALGIAAAVLVGAYGAFHSARHHDVHVVNGFGQQIQISLGPATFNVPPGGHQLVNVPLGTLAARAVTADGVVLDEGPLAVGMGSDVLVWNVAGVAPVMERQVEYYSGTPPANASEPDPVLHCGERRISLHGVDYPFRDPPRQVSMSKGSSRVVRRALMLAQEKDADGAFLCSFVLSGKQNWRAAAAVLEQRARAAHWEMHAGSMAVWSAKRVGVDEELRVARAMRDARPDDVQVHRLYQTVAQASGDRAQLREEYRKRAEASPGSATAQYLYLRLLPLEEAQGPAEDLLKRFPADGHVLRLVCGNHFERRDWGGLDRTWRTLLASSIADAAELVEAEATALVELGRAQEGLRLVEDLFPRIEAGARPDVALVYARLAQRTGAPSPDRFVAELESDDRPVVRAKAGLPPGDQDESTPVVELIRTAGTDPAAALDKLAALGPLAVTGLDPETMTLLHGEALRSGHTALKVFEGTVYLEKEDLQQLQRFVRGEAGASLPRLDLGIQAAAELVRSRASTLPAAERSALRAAALKDDVLGTVVTRAVKAWPEPGR